MARKNVIKDKTYLFGIHVVKICKQIENEQREYTLSKQFKRSGTAPGALVRESEHAESKKDFIHKLSIALKEANETDYWLDMMREGEYIDVDEYELLKKECDEIVRILVAIVRTSKAQLEK